MTVLWWTLGASDGVVVNLLHNGSEWRRGARTALLAVFVVGSLVGCDGDANGDAPGKQAPAPARVEFTEIAEDALVDTWTYLGQARANSRASLAAGASAEVLAVSVREGDVVQPGELLVSLDASLVEARVSSARASRSRSAALLSQAKRDRKRTEQLGAAIVPRQEIERDRSSAAALGAEVRSLEAAASEASVLVDRHRVVAPFSGVVVARQVDPGDWVQAGDAVLELVEVDAVEIMVDVDPALLEHIAAGGRARVRPTDPARANTTITSKSGAEQQGDGSADVERDADGSVAATIAGIVPALDTVTRTAKVRLRPSSAPRWLMPGAAVRVDFAVERRGQGVVVPRDALVIGPTETRVIRIKAGEGGETAEPVVVRVLATAGDRALVTGALALGERVVTRGNERLRPGQALELVTGALTGAGGAGGGR